MREALASFLGFTPPRAAFEGSPGEERVYTAAVAQWRAAGYYLHEHRLVRPTFGARVERTRGLSRRLA